MKHVGSGFWFALLLTLSIAPSLAFATDREVASKEDLRVAVSSDFSGQEEKDFLCSHLASNFDATDLSNEERARVKEEHRRLCR